MICEAKTEQEMRDCECPWPETEEELLEYIRSLLNRDHSHRTLGYAMSLAATAALHYAASVVGAYGNAVPFAGSNVL